MMDTTLRFIDSHCHLTDLTAEELAHTLDFAKENHVSHLVAIGAGNGFDDNLKTLEIAKTHSNIVCALAIHPHDAKDVTDEQLDKLKNLCLTEDKVKAVGEIGLDYHYMNSNKEDQIRILRDFCQLAKQINKPVVIHDRDCANECVDLLKSENMSSTGGMVHCFSGSWDLAQRYLDLDFFVSFTGIITFKKADDLREVVKKTPLDRMLIETDSPFLAPIPYRGRRNEPAYVCQVAECVAQVKNIPLSEVAQITTRNALNFFRIT